MNWHDVSDEAKRTLGVQTSSPNVYSPEKNNLLVFPTSTHQPCIMFDLDGVLIDTRPLVANALAYVANVLNVDLPSEKKLLAAISLSPRKAVSALFPKHAAALRIFQAGINRYVHQLMPCPGVVELLDQWRDEHMAVVTSRNQADTNLYLSCSGLSHFFQVIITWGHTSRHKPHPEPLLEAARLLGRADGIYVGDAPGDMIAAKAGGFYPVGALWASQWSRSKLLEAGAAFVAEQPEDLINHLQDKEA